MKHSRDEALALLFDSALSRLMLASILMADDMDRGLTDRGLTRTRATALWEISNRESITQRELADALRVTPRNVTTLVDALEATGFAKRVGHPTDRRARLIALTSKGQDAVVRMKSEKREFAEMLFADLARSNLEALVTALDHIIDRLVATKQEPKSA